MRDIMSWYWNIDIGQWWSEERGDETKDDHLHPPASLLSHSHSSMLFEPFPLTSGEYSENHVFLVMSLADRRWVGSYDSISWRSLRNVSCWLGKRCAQWSLSRDASGRLGWKDLSYHHKTGAYSIQVNECSHFAGKGPSTSTIVPSIIYALSKTMGKSFTELWISKIRHARAQISLFFEGKPKHISGARNDRGVPKPFGGFLVKKD